MRRAVFILRRAPFCLATRQAAACPRPQSLPMPPVFASVRSRSPARRAWRAAQPVVLSVAALSCTCPQYAQTGQAPAGTDSPRPQLTQPAASAGQGAKDRREAEDAFLKGSRALEAKKLDEAEQDFAHAVRLNPTNVDYTVALSLLREHRLADLVHQAARASAEGHKEEAQRLLLQAHEIDPANPVILQHFAADGSLVPLPAPREADPAAQARSEDAALLAGPVRLLPAAGTHSFHLHAGAQDLITQVCAAYGIRSEMASPIGTGGSIRFDLDDATFAQALHVVQTLTNTFSVPLQPNQLLFALDTTENRAQYQPLIEETLYMPGVSQTDLNEYATLVRNVFNPRVVNAVSNSSSLVLRGDEDTLQHINATFAELVDGGAEVLVELNLYEIDRSRINNLGVQLPSSVGVFPIAATAQSLISANQSLISQAIANNLITLTGNSYTDALTELEFLLASGAVSSSQFSNLLGVFGHYGGLPLAGAYLGSTSTLNAALNSSDVRILDTLQLRLHDRQDGQFRAGTRYPIETGIYSSNLSNNISSAVAGLTINGTSVSSLLSQYLGSTSASVPQIQFEDLGLTLKATPQVLRTGEVQLKLDMKIEALGSGSINTLPILNNRQLISTVTIPRGQTALLVSDVSSTEFRAITGLPFLSEIPGFQITNKSTEKDTSELLITLTPHIVRNQRLHITSRRFLLADSKASGTQ